MIDDVTMGGLNRTYFQWASIQGEALSSGNPVTENRRSSVNGKTILPDPAFNLSARAVPGSGKYFLHSFRHMSISIYLSWPRHKAMAHAGCGQIQERL
jgi:hypothetical protein